MGITKTSNKGILTGALYFFWAFCYTSATMVVRMRHTRAHTANRRSHHALDGARLSKCVKCEALHLRHVVCTTCGTYRGKAVLSLAKTMAKTEKRVAAKGKATK